MLDIFIFILINTAMSFSLKFNGEPMTFIIALDQLIQGQFLFALETPALIISSCIMDSNGSWDKCNSCPGHHMDNSFCLALPLGCIAVTAPEDDADKSTKPVQ